MAFASPADLSYAQVLETWIIAGQSNAEGYAITQNPVTGLLPSSTLASVGRSDLLPNNNNVSIFQGANSSHTPSTSAGMTLPPKNSWHAMTSAEGLSYDWGSGRGNESGQRFGPELAFGFDVQNQVGSPIALIKYARGSTPIASSNTSSDGFYVDFDPSDGGRPNQYDKLISTIQGAIDNLPTGQTLNLRGILWMQGEADANSSSAPAYQANLTEFIAALRANLGTIAAASSGKLTRSAASWNEIDVFIGTIQALNSDFQTVVNAQNAVAAADPNVFTVNATTGLSTMTVDDWNIAGLHYNTAGQVLLGERFADIAISRIDSGVMIAPSNGSTVVTEGGTTDNYTVRLTRAPSSNVVINITGNSQVTTSPSSLTFTTTNWNTPQTVTVTAVNDSIREPLHSGIITHSLTSSDLSFGNLPLSSVAVEIRDNPANLLPVLSPISNKNVRQGSSLSFTASAVDTNVPPDPLTYSLIGAPPGVAINSTTGSVTWTPTLSQKGVFSLSIRASDGGLSHEQPVSITVIPASSLDSDGDGMADMLEIAFGSYSDTSNQKTFQIKNSTPGAIALEFPWDRNVSGLSWLVRHSDDLTIPRSSWPILTPSSVTTQSTGSLDIIRVVAPASSNTRRFYIVEVLAN